MIQRFLCAALLVAFAPAQDKPANKSDADQVGPTAPSVQDAQLRVQLKKLKAELENLRYLKQKGGIGARLTNMMASRVLEVRATDPGSKPLQPERGRRMARLMTKEERTQLLRTAAFSVDGVPILRSSIDQMAKFVKARYPKLSELESQRTAVADLMRIASAKAQFKDGEDAANKLIRKVASDLSSGVDFARLAKAHSRAPGASDGGARGWVKFPTESQSFDLTVLSLKEGDTSGPFLTHLGYNLVRVIGIREGDDGIQERNIKHILIPFINEVDEVSQAQSRVTNGTATVLYADDETLQMLPAIYR